ncbi:hypothetical protein [Flagellimonas baculiformis]|uniref:hypothetical protein n=1 Tax=Flagellimonas baculiformis TaxID=3067310 RepID=UPI00296EA1B5|nr:hypothetical protein [Muricauda sp. D6]
MKIGEKFYQFCIKHGIGKWEWNFDSTIPITELIFSTEEIYKLNDLKVIFSGEKGGLVLGNSHNDGGIHLLQLDIDKNIMKYVGEMEGFEYLSSPLKSEKHLNELSELNNLTTEIDVSKKVTIPKGCNIIDTSNIDVPVILLSGFKQFIINKNSTFNYLNKILEIEKKY